jgi:hypothetical protein
MRLLLALVVLAGPVMAEGLDLPQIGDAPRQNGFLPQVSHAAPGEGSPAETVRAFIAAMEEGNDDPNLAVYSAASRLMLRGISASPAQMRAVVDTYNRCGIPESLIDGGVAVERYAVSARQCPPVLLFRENGAWVLDLVTASGVIRFNRKNEWHFSGGIPEGYAFAFTDWVLDSDGYPHEAGGILPQAGDY